MKLPSLLSEYLREHKMLSLPGIGIFHLTGTLPSTTESSEALSSSISFEHKKIKEPEDKLIDFIKQHTGKIKPLAIADLDTFISNGLQLLNIGKPFYIEGIGSIQKGKGGQYEFTVGEITSTKLELYNSTTEEKKSSVFEESKFEPKSNPWQKILSIGLVIIGMAVVIFGGYYLYNKNGNPNTKDEPSTLQDSPKPVQQEVDSTVKQQPQDSTVAKTDSIVLASKETPTYKFVVLNTPNKRRAMARYDQLKFTSIKMETKDSTNFKLYFLINAVAGDTTKIKDSLSRYYANKVVVER